MAARFVRTFVNWVNVDYIKLIRVLEDSPANWNVRVMFTDNTEANFYAGIATEAEANNILKQLMSELDGVDPADFVDL